MLEAISRQGTLDVEPAEAETARKELIDQKEGRRPHHSHTCRRVRTITFEPEIITARPRRKAATEASPPRLPSSADVPAQRQLVIALAGDANRAAAQAVKLEGADTGAAILGGLDLAHWTGDGVEMVGLVECAPALTVGLSAAALAKTIAEIGEANEHGRVHRERRRYVSAYADGMASVLAGGGDPPEAPLLRSAYERGRAAACSLSPEEKRQLEDGLVRVRARATFTEEADSDLARMYGREVYREALMDLWEGVVDP